MALRSGPYIFRPERMRRMRHRRYYKCDHGWKAYGIKKIKMKDGGQEMNIYYIGGSPCAGKSSVAEILSQRYGLYYFKPDDFLDRYMQSGAQKGYPICRKTAGMDAEQIWMREPLLQCREEFDIYREIIGYIVKAGDGALP